MKKIYNRAVSIPLLLELLSRLRTELTGKMDDKLINVNRMLYSIAEGLKYYDLKRENIDKIIEYAVNSYTKKRKDIKVKKYADYLLQIIKIANSVRDGLNAKRNH